MDIIIPSAISIIGFVITFRKMKKEYLYQQKLKYSEKCMEIVEKLPLLILEYLDILKKFGYGYLSVVDKMQEKANEIRNMIIPYASKDAMKIWEYICQTVAETTENMDNTSKIGGEKIIAPVAILLMQVKFDLTGIEASPQIWYVGEYTTKKALENGNFYQESIEENNKIVKELGLKNFLKIELKDKSGNFQMS
ncbi:hypothetical protein I6E50_14005 [Roseburia hominis]|nr:hypothetical protein [Roseburia hominis]